MKLEINDNLKNVLLVTIIGLMTLLFVKNCGDILNQEYNYKLKKGNCLNKDKQS